MESIPLPSKIETVESRKDWARFVIEPCYPGYGTTLGNALRRVLLSSLPGAAITAVKIENVNHEFSTVPYIKEDAVSILLNLKLVRFKLHADEPVTLKLNVKGASTVTAADFEAPSTVEIINGKQTIATLTDKAAALTMEIMVAPGRGYVPVENREKEKLEIGWIAVDAVYTPIKVVNFTVENVRVGQITNFDRLVLEVETDGTISPPQALTEAAQILVGHFTEFAKVSEIAPKKKRGRSKKETTEPEPSDQPLPSAEPAPNGPTEDAPPE
ncbi:MAG: DNA-directed RNA polymerase subunit alpha [Candidatus Kerfeldbacteria bacterium]|nr:DNA-directed RNA polymerase subunit alpha [Candidatus Kerfeldbacteria bacterium]